MSPINPASFMSDLLLIYYAFYYQGFDGGRFGVGLALELEFILPFPFAFACCFFNISSACFLPSLIRCAPSCAFSSSSLARESFGSSSSAFLNAAPASGSWGHLV